jgi:hypothetical protein
MPRVWAVGLTLLILASCARPGGEGVPATSGESAFALPWIADDYPKALAEARARQLPIFVDSWAPW